MSPRAQEHPRLSLRHEVEVQIRVILTSIPVRGEWSVSRPCRFTPRETATGTPMTGSWVRYTSDLDDMEKWKFLTRPGLELRPVGHPARSQSLNRLRYRGSQFEKQAKQAPTVARLHVSMTH
jgi:hypothetical protein